MKKIAVSLGEACNFFCAHCLIPPEDRNHRLLPEEIALLPREIDGGEFKTILFVGGEPTLYINDINTILSGLRTLANTTVKITTNGAFAITPEAASKVLSSFIKLDAVQLSYDVFHKKFMPLSRVRNLYRACVQAGKSFSIVFSVQSPTDMWLLKRIREIGDFEIGMQKVLPLGMARRNGLYFKYPSFDDSVWKKKCPGGDEINYIPGRGFTSCCSNIVFNKVLPGSAHATVKAHLGSRFYLLIKSRNFKQLAEMFHVESEAMNPECSGECSLCEYIFHAAMKRGLWEEK